MMLMVDNPNQLDLLAEPAPRPIEEARAALLNAKPSPIHRDDPETSWHASVAAAVRASDLRKRVLFALADAGDLGMTDWELSVSLECLRTTAGKRRGELKQAGLCSRSDRRRVTDTHSTAVVWCVTELGREVVQELMEGAGS